jgi:acyl carrier protein
MKLRKSIVEAYTQKRLASTCVSNLRNETIAARGERWMNVDNTNTPQTIEEGELARLIVSTLNLEVAAGEIDPGAPLYGEGLGLDSIDMLEIALVVSQRFGVKLRADDENNVRIFSSLRSLNRFIQDQRDT